MNAHAMWRFTLGNYRAPQSADGQKNGCNLLNKLARPKRFELLTPWFVVITSRAHLHHINELATSRKQSVTEPCGSALIDIGQNSGSDLPGAESIEITIRQCNSAQVMNYSGFSNGSELVYRPEERQKICEESRGPFWI